MLIQLFLIGFASSDWKKYLLSHGDTTTHHQFQDQKLELAEAEETLGLEQQQRQSSSSFGDRRGSRPRTTPQRITPDNEPVTPEKIRQIFINLEKQLTEERESSGCPKIETLHTAASYISAFNARTDLDTKTQETLKRLSQDSEVSTLIEKQRAHLEEIKQIIKHPQVAARVNEYNYRRRQKEQTALKSTKKSTSPMTVENTENLAFSLRMKGIKDSLNSQLSEVRRAACKTLESIMSSHETNPDEWTELVAHSTYQAYLRKKYPPTAASRQSKTTWEQEESAAIASTRNERRSNEQAGVSALSISAGQRHESSREDQIRQEWREAIRDLKEEDLDDDELEGHLLMIDADYHCQLGELFKSLGQPEKAKVEYQKAVLAYWDVEVRSADILETPWCQTISQHLNQDKQFRKIYQNTVEKCRKKQDQYFVPAYYSFSGACDGLIEARYRMELGDYEEAARYLQFFEEHGPNWDRIDSSEYAKKCNKQKARYENLCCDLNEHKTYYNKTLAQLRRHSEIKKAYEALKAQNRRDFWTLGVGGLVGMAAFCTGFLFLINYFLPKDQATTDTNALTNPFGGIIGNVTESFSPGSNFSEFLADVITNATSDFSAQQQNISASGATNSALTPFVFSNALAPAVQSCTDLARCMLSNATFVAFLNQYLLNPACGSAPAQFLHNLTCALIGKYYQYTQAVNMMCVLVKLQEANWVGVCAPTLPEDSGSIQDGSTCLEPGPMPPIRYSSVNLEIHRSGGKRLSGSCVTKRQANPFVPTETRELTISDELTDTPSEELSPDKSASSSRSRRSGTRDDSASRSHTPLRKKPRTGTDTLAPPPSLSRSDPLSRSESLSLPLCCADTAFCVIPAGWGCCPRPSCYPTPWSISGCYSACNANGTWAADLTGKPRPGNSRSTGNRCACPNPSSPPPPTTTHLIQWVLQNMTNYPAREFWVWRELIANGTAGSPPARWAHSTWTLNGKLYVGFGSADERSAYDDMWEFAPQTKTWKNITPIEGFRPSPREFAGSYVNGASSICAFGGNNPVPSFPGSIFNDLTCFDPIQNWTTLTINGASGSPPARHAPACSMIGNSVFQFGGWSPSSSNGDNRLWQYNGSWIDVTPGISPGLRWHMKMATIGPNVWMFGGLSRIGGDHNMNDLWKLNRSDSGAFLWTLVTPDTISTTSPEKRAKYAIGSMQDKIILFGGSTNNVWVFDTITLTWMEVIKNLQPGSPSARSSNANFACIDNKTCLLFGGQIQPSNIPSNDLWQFFEEEISLYDVRASSPIYANTPFNFSWKVNSTSGSKNHTATIDLNGTKYIAVYKNALTQISLNVSNLRDFYLTLTVNDTEHPAVFANQTLNFALNP